MKSRLSLFKTTIMYGAALLLLISLFACGQSSGGSSDVPAGGGGGGGGTGGVTVLANPSSITAGGTSTITVTVKDSGGNPVADGTSVTFSLSSNAYGSLSNATVTTAGGVATTTFTAGSTPGSVTITATSGGASNSTSLTIGTVSAGSIQFVSATPKVLGIKGSGQAEISEIKFLVNDSNGAPVNGASVSFTMVGPNGGEYIGDIDSTPNTASGTTVNGHVSTILHSGTIAGPVNVTASTTVAGGPISTAATPISIGGGVPSATHFTIAETKINLEGLNWVNLQSTVSAYLADRFGNYNVLRGTSVSFYAEAGAIDRQGVTGGLEVEGELDSEIAFNQGDTGAANVVFRTQNPMPEDVAPATAGDTVSTTYFGGENEPFYISGGHTYNPRDGWGTIFAVAKGEEKFLDENLDGLFTRSYKDDKCPYGNDVVCECDGGTTVAKGVTCPGGEKRSEGFIDLPGDPYYDVNDDGLRDDGQTAGEPFELYIDAIQNGTFDASNGKWDGPDCQTLGCETSKTIWPGHQSFFSGGPRFYPNPDVNNCYNLVTENAACSATYASGKFAIAPASIPMGGSYFFRVIVGDINLNTLQGGTTITVTASPVTTEDIVGLFTIITTVTPTVTPAEFTIPDGLSTGPTFFDFTVTIPSGTTTTPTTLTVEVKTPNGTTNTTSITVPII